MSWDYIPAEQFCDSVRDGTHGTPKPTDSGYKLITGKHVKDGQIIPITDLIVEKKKLQNLQMQLKTRLMN